MPERLTVGQFQDAIRSGRFLPGDAVLYWYPRRNPVQWGIRHTQERALRDLVAGSDDAEALAQLDHAIGVASQYTHAGMIRNAAASAEMTSPHARLISWSDRLRPGYRLLVVRPRAPETDASGGRGTGAAPRTPQTMRATAGTDGAGVDASASVPPSPAVGAASTRAGILDGHTARAADVLPDGRMSGGSRLDEGCGGTPLRSRSNQSGSPPEAEFALRQASAEMLELACHRAPYPYSEALAYWFASWPAKLSGRRFAEVFRYCERDVCSGAVWAAWASAGCIAPEGLDGRSEAWYPGRMAWDACVEHRYLRCIAECLIGTEDCRGCTPAPLKNTAQGEGPMKTRQGDTGIGGALVVVGILALSVALASLLTGCKGMNKCPDEAGIGRTIKVYEINVASEARSQVFIGTVATQTPMYQETENAAEQPGVGTAYVTTPAQPVTAGANGGTASGKYVLQVINDGAKRAAETDLATAATLATGLQQSQVGQTAPQTQREGTSTGTQTQSSSPQQNDATQIAPNTPVSTGAGTSQVTTPTATQAGAGATPAAVTGGTTTTPASTTTTN